jgi:carbon monoxide dehydrogenase subunit G
MVGWIEEFKWDSGGWWDSLRSLQNFYQCFPGIKSSGSPSRQTVWFGTEDVVDVSFVRHIEGRVAFSGPVIEVLAGDRGFEAGGAGEAEEGNAAFVLAEELVEAIADGLLGDFVAGVEGGDTESQRDQAEENQEGQGDDQPTPCELRQDDD